MADSVKIEGLDELVRAFAQLPDDAVKSIKPVATASANKVLAKAQSNLTSGGHVRRGNLLKSLKVNKPKAGAKYKYYIFSSVWFGESGRHGVPLELGHRFSGYLWRQANTRKVEPVPFLRNAADELEQQVMDDLVQGIDAALDKFGDKG